MYTTLLTPNFDDFLDIDYYIDIIDKLIDLLHKISGDPLAYFAVTLVFVITIIKLILKYRKRK
jgi:hypothetical protein